MSDLSISIEEIYAAPISTLWRAITDKEEMKQWYFDIKDFVLQKDTVFNFYESGGKNLYHHRCVILEIVPNKKLQYTWTHPSHSKGSSILTWILDTTDNGTKVTLIHEGVENLMDGGDAFKKENYLIGWTEILGTSLKNFVEK